MHSIKVCGMFCLANYGLNQSVLFFVDYINPITIQFNQIVKGVYGKRKKYLLLSWMTESLFNNSECNPLKMNVNVLYWITSENV